MKKIQFKFYKTVPRYYSFFILSAIALTLFGSCKKQLNVQDPNDPTFEGNVNNEAGITAYAKGVVFFNGFKYGDNWLGDSYFSLPWGYHELMGDVIAGGGSSNNQITTMAVPDKVQADPNDPSTIITNSAKTVNIIRTFNTSAATANNNNALYYEWLNMYALNNGCNLTLEHLPNVPISADKANTIKAWCYWWKGFAYAQIGTLYYAGLIVDHSNTIVNKYVSQADIIAESNRNLNLALTTLRAITNQSDYNTVIAELIPAQNQVGLGRPLTSGQFINTINSMLARNILLNHLAPFVNGNPNATISKSTIPVMTAADWQSVITLSTSGVQLNDNVFTGRTSPSNSFFSATTGSVAAILTISNQGSNYKLSERLVQQFKAGDKRLANFTTANGTYTGDVNTNTTRWTLVDGAAKGLTGIPILGSVLPGQLEIYIGPTYEETQLMLAEANIRTGNIEAGLGYIDNVRNYQGAGVAAVKGTGLTLTQALQELTMERFAALAFRGLSFYDSRRFGWTYSIANGGGRYGNTLIYNNTVYTNAIFDYNYMDYWDVPADEKDKNPPAAGSAPVMNANY